MISIILFEFYLKLVLNEVVHAKQFFSFSQGRKFLSFETKYSRMDEVLPIFIFRQVSFFV